MDSSNYKKVGTFGDKKLPKSKTRQPSSNITPTIVPFSSNDFLSTSKLEGSTSKGMPLYIKI